MKVPTRLLHSVWPFVGDNVPGQQKFDDLMASIQEEGIREPLTIGLDWKIIDGCHRLAVAQRLGIEWVEVRIWTGREFVQSPRADQ